MAHRDLNFDFKKPSWRLRTLESIVENSDSLWDGDAMCQLGEIYLNGWEGVKRDPERAYHLFCQAAIDDDMAVCNVGLCLWKGWGTEQNIFQAIYYFAWAIYGTWNEADHYHDEDLEARKDAIRNLKACFESMSYEEQEEMLERLMHDMKTNRLLLPVVGYCYMNGYGVERNLMEAKHIFDYNGEGSFSEPPYKHVARALRDGHIQSVVTDEMMETYEPINNLESIYLPALAKEGRYDVVFYESIQYEYCENYPSGSFEDYQGDDDAPVYSENEYIEQQLESFNHTAEVNYKLGKYLLNGAHGVKKNKELAFKHFLAAARNHSCLDGPKDKYYYRTGVCYMKGIGTQQDWLKAAFCFMETLYSKEYMKAWRQKPDFNVCREAKKNLTRCFDNISREEQERLVGRMVEEMKRNRIFIPLVAYCYMNGYGVQQNLAEAKYLFDYKTEKKKQKSEVKYTSLFPTDVEAYTLLGRALRDDDVLNDVDEETMRVYKPSVKLNDIYHPYFLEHGYYDTASWKLNILEVGHKLMTSAFNYDNYVSSLEYYTGEFEEIYELGLCFLNGTYGLKKDEKMAFSKFMAAASAQQRCSNKEYYMLGLCYMQGIGVRQDINKAIFCFILSLHDYLELKDGHWFCWYEGRQPDRNAYNEAKSMLKKCFESIDNEEQRKPVEKFIARIRLDSRFIAIVAYCFQYGYGVEQDIVEAKRLFGHHEESTYREEEYQRMVRALCDDSLLNAVDENTLKSHKPVVDTSEAHMTFHTYDDSSYEHVDEFCYYIDEEELMDFEDGRIEDYAFYGCRFWKDNIVLPDTVHHIGDGAFWGCPNLKTLVIPTSVKHIGRNFLDECGYLKSVTVMWNSPLEIEYPSTYMKKTSRPDMYGRQPREPILYVPKGTAEKYRKARFWGDFPTITEYSVDGCGL